MAKRKTNPVTVRDEVLDAIERLPDGATFEDAIYTLNVLWKVERGLEDAAAGRTIPHEKVMAMIAERRLNMANRQTPPPFPPPKEAKPPEFPIQKDDVLGNLRCLPEDMTIDEAVDRLYFLNRIARARAEIAAGQTFTQEEARARLLPWLP